jgi:selenophosphate synthetase-related protein
MNLEKIAESIRNNPYILEKKEISPIVQFIDKNSYNSERIFASIGEDSAAIDDNDKLILLTTDRIRTQFIEKFPFGAGFSSILVSVDDIYACGGIPLAASIIISVKDEDLSQLLLDGVCEASCKFQVPIIRGHTNIHANGYELSTTMVGEIDKKDYISAGNAQINDKIVLIVDYNGKIGKASTLYYDTTTFAESETVLKKRKAMNVVAKKHLVNASKDVSNGGIFGTLLQMIKYSKVGADICINKIKIPPVLKEYGYDLETYLKMYLTTSFILTAPKDNCKKIIEIFKEHELDARIIGKIISEQDLLKINDGKDSTNVIRF